MYSSRLFGDMAIQILFAESNLRNIIEGNYSKEKKDKAQKDLDVLDNYAKRILFLSEVSKINRKEKSMSYQLYIGERDFISYA